MTTKPASSALLALALAAGLTAAANAQTQTTAPAAAAPRVSDTVRQAIQNPTLQVDPRILDRLAVRATPASREQVEKLVTEALPRAEGRFATGRQDPDWVSKLDLGALAGILDDSFLEAQIARFREAEAQADGKIPPGPRVFRTETSTLRIDPAAGSLRYVNLDRALKPDALPSALPDEGKRKEIAARVFNVLALPDANLGAAQFTEQWTGGGSAQSAKLEVSQAVRALVSLDRSIDGLPVLGATARLAITEDGQIERLRIDWPPFRTEGSDKPLDQRALVSGIVDQLMDQNATTAMQLSARLGYAPVDARRGSHYAPAMLIAVTDGETPYLMSAPVVAPSETDD